jgi:hypothetical protein
MKKLLIVLAVVAAAAPAALAKQPPHATPPSKATKNIAWVCKTLRATNPSAFNAAWGTNGNHRNAYGKCVSFKARAKHHGGTISLKKLTLASTGTITGAGAAGCQTMATGCTLTSTGNVTGPLLGTYSSTFTILWATTGQPNPAVAGGFCADASGDVTLTLPGLGTLTKHETGKVCETTATGANVPHQFNGTFTVTSGTGIFAGATGEGSTTSTQQPGATSAQGGAVTGSESFTKLTLHL